MKTNNPQVIELWLSDVREIGVWPGSGFEVLPPELQDEIMAYRQIDDQQRVYLGKRLMAKMFSDLATPEQVFSSCRRDDCGKPFIPEFPDFNISHSGNWVAGARIAEGKVGVDIEMIRPIEIDLFHRQFTESERDAMKKSSDPLSTFFTAWTAKEALMKADGRGMRIPPHQIHISAGRARIEQEGVEFYCHPFQAPEGYKGHLCADVPFQFVITFVTIHG